MPIDISFKATNSLNKFTSKVYADQNYVNVEGDTLQGDLNLNNNKIINLAKPTDDKDCATKSYVDERLSKLPTTEYVDGLKESVIRVKSTLVPKHVVTIERLASGHSFFILGVWFEGEDMLWYDSRSDHCRELKVNYKQRDADLHITCKNIPSRLTGKFVVLIKRDVNVPFTKNLLPYPDIGITSTG